MWIAMADSVLKVVSMFMLRLYWLELANSEEGVLSLVPLINTNGRGIG